ncbi:MAG: hypothetical protein ISS19_04135 [Bacteroidales bacterium]|nr:hypothetical protein [Bacteroidales bacterium]
MGDQVRHRTILSLGTLDELTEKQDFKLLADRVEQLVKGLSELFVVQNPVVERLAVQFYSEIVNKNLIDQVQTNPAGKNFQAIDVESIELENAREIGSEWMCYQALHPNTQPRSG